MVLTIFGYPKTGKTTLFNLLTGAKIEVRSYEDGKKEANQRTCHIPDRRLDRVAGLYPDKKKVTATLELIDLAGESYGEVKNSVYLGILRKADGLIHVARGFEDPNIPHPKGKVSARGDIAAMEDEMVLADLISVTARLEKLEKDLRKAKDPEGEKEKDLLALFRAALEEGKPIRELEFSAAEEKLLRSFAFLSQKPLLHVVNVDESQIPLLAAPEKIAHSPRPGTAVLAFCGKIESEILELEDEEKKAFMEEYGLKETSAEMFFRAIPALLRLISFFTVGKNEVRAWTVPVDSPAGQAAGAIHSDIERGFIRAEVIPWDVLLGLGSLQAAKDKGAIRLEGKDYIVQDGDVIYFRFAA